MSGAPMGAADARERRLAWTGLLLGPAGVFVTQEIAYAMVTRACLWGNPLGLHLAALGGILLIVAGGLISLHVWRTIDRQEPTPSASPRHRSLRLLNMLGIFAAGVALLVVLAQWIAMGMLSPCQ